MKKARSIGQRAKGKEQGVRNYISKPKTSIKQIVSGIQHPVSSNKHPASRNISYCPR
jgi:hypothetical protein